jgi:hypothetical protein
LGVPSGETSLPSLTIAGGSTDTVSTDPTHELNFANVRDGHIKFKNLKKDQLNELCATFFNHIKDLELRLEKSKAPPPPSPTRPTSSGPSSRS